MSYLKSNGGCFLEGSENHKRNFVHHHVSVNQVSFISLISVKYELVGNPCNIPQNFAGNCTGVKVIIGLKVASKCSLPEPDWISEYFEATFDPINTLTPLLQCLQYTTISMSQNQHKHNTELGNMSTGRQSGIPAFLGASEMLSQSEFDSSAIAYGFHKPQTTEPNF